MLSWQKGPVAAFTTTGVLADAAAAVAAAVVAAAAVAALAAVTVDRGTLSGYGWIARS